MLDSDFLPLFRTSLSVQSQGHRHCRMAHGAMFFYDECTTDAMLDMLAIGAPPSAAATSTSAAHKPLLKAGIEGAAEFKSRAVSPMPLHWSAASGEVAFAQFSTAYEPLLHTAAQSDCVVAALTVRDAVLVLEADTPPFGDIINGPLLAFEHGPLFSSSSSASLDSPPLQQMADASLDRFAAYFFGAGALPALPDLVPQLTAPSTVAPADLAQAALELYAFVARRMALLIDAYAAKGAPPAASLAKLHATMQHYLEWRYVVAPLLYEGAAAFAAMVLCPAPVIYDGLALDIDVPCEPGKLYNAYVVHNTYVDAAMQRPVSVDSYPATALDFALHMLRLMAPCFVQQGFSAEALAMFVLLQRSLFLRFIAPQFLGAKQTLAVAKDMQCFVRLANYRSGGAAVALPPDFARALAQLVSASGEGTHLGAASQSVVGHPVVHCVCPGIAPAALDHIVPAAIGYEIVQKPKDAEYRLERKAFVHYVANAQRRSAEGRNAQRKHHFLERGELAAMGDGAGVLYIYQFGLRRPTGVAQRAPAPLLRAAAAATALGRPASMLNRGKHRLTAANFAAVDSIMRAHCATLYVHDKRDGSERVLYSAAAAPASVAAKQPAAAAAPRVSRFDRERSIWEYFNSTNSASDALPAIFAVACAQAPFYAHSELAPKPLRQVVSSSSSSSTCSSRKRTHAAAVDDTDSSSKRHCAAAAQPNSARNDISLVKFFAAYVYYTKFCQSTGDYLACAQHVGIELVARAKEQYRVGAGKECRLYVVLNAQSPLVPVAAAIRKQHIRTRTIFSAISPILH